jgi:hypothetical protein
MKTLLLATLLLVGCGSAGSDSKDKPEPVDAMALAMATCDQLDPAVVTGMGGNMQCDLFFECLIKSCKGYENWSTAAEPEACMVNVTPDTKAACRSVAGIGGVK